MTNSLSNYAATQRKGKAATPQGVATPGRTDEVVNHAGGYVFKVSDVDRLERFLILGTDGATYYVGADEQVTKSVDFLRDMIARDETLVLNRLVDVSTNGRAYKNSPAIFALAAVLTFGTNKAAARARVNDVVRTATHLFEFTEYLKALGGMGRAKRAALAGWYEAKTPEQIAYQAVKYRQRNGYTHRDVFRIAHPKGVDPVVGDFILGKELRPEATDAAGTLIGFQLMQDADSAKRVISVLETYKNLPWETIPTQFLKDVDVWKSLFYNGQLNGQALVRNITRLARLDAFADMGFAADYAAKLVDPAMIERTRLHPVNYLNASVVYNEGQMERSGYWAERKKNWTTESVIADALDAGFYEAFKHVEPAGKRTMLAIDVSGSMSSPAMGLDLSCAQVSGAVAMTVARTEPAHIIRGFTTGASGWRRRGDAELTDLGITARTPLATAMNKVQNHNFGGTDCAQPMVWARENKVKVDTFVVITDSETWAGNVKPTQALKQYRDAMGIPARLAVLGVEGEEFTIADPTDKGQMDFVGFDSAAPKVLADFSAGRI